MDLGRHLNRYPFTGGVLTVAVTLAPASTALNGLLNRSFTDVLLVLFAAMMVRERYRNPKSVVRLGGSPQDRKIRLGMYFGASLIIAAQLSGQTEWGAQMRQKMLNPLKDEFHSAMKMFKWPELPVLGAARVDPSGTTRGTVFRNPSP